MIRQRGDNEAVASEADAQKNGCRPSRIVTDGASLENGSDPGVLFKRLRWCSEPDSAAMRARQTDIIELEMVCVRFAPCEWHNSQVTK